MSDRLLELLREHSYREGDFVLASGARSSYYVDVRRTSLTAEGSVLIGERLLGLIQSKGWAPDAVGGMTLGADPLTTAVGIAAFRAGVPLTCFLVRKEPKGHGAGKQVEAAGDMPTAPRVVILEDTTTTGGSTARAIEAARAAGYEVVAAVTIVDRQQGAEARLRELDVAFASLFTVEDLRDAASP